MCFWIWNDGLLVHGNFNTWNRHVISLSVELQPNFISIYIILLFTEVTPKFVVLSDQSVEMDLVELENSFC